KRRLLQQAINRNWVRSLSPKTRAGAIAIPIAVIPDAASNTDTLQANRKAAMELFALQTFFGTLIVVVRNSHWPTTFCAARVVSMSDVQQIRVRAERLYALAL